MFIEHYVIKVAWTNQGLINFSVENGIHIPERPINIENVANRAFSGKKNRRPFIGGGINISHNSAAAIYRNLAFAKFFVIASANNLCDRLQRLIFHPVRTETLDQLVNLAHG